MKTSRTAFYLISNLIWLLGATNLLAAQNISPSRETSIRRLLIPIFKVRARDFNTEKLWNDRNPEVQEALIKAFIETKSIEPILSSKSYNLDSKPEIYNSDAVLLGEFHDSDLEIDVMSAVTDRILDKIIFPIADPQLQSPKDLAALIVSTFLSKIKYVGFITAIHNNEAKINVGSKAGLKSGDTLVLFDFDGDHPVLSGHIHRVGVFKLSKVVDNASLGIFIPATVNTKVVVYTKVAIPRKPAPKPVYKTPAKNSPPPAQTAPAPVAADNPGFWISAGAGVYSLNTTVGGTTPSLQSRSLQVSLSPAGSLGFGYSRFSMEFLYSAASNSSNALSILEGTALFRIISTNSSSINFYTSLGLFVDQNQVTPAANPTSVLISSMTFSPEIQEYIKWSFKTSYVYGAVDLLYPAFSSDSSNGSSQSSSSFGGGIEVGWRFQLSQNWSVDLNLRSYYLAIQTQYGPINQMDYNFGPRLFYNF